MVAAGNIRYGKSCAIQVYFHCLFIGSLLLWSHAVPADPGYFKLHELQEKGLEMHWTHYLHPGGYPRHETMFTQWDMGYHVRHSSIQCTAKTF
jgi:hypothetical protein